MSAPELSPAERDVVARFDAAPALPESWEGAEPDPRFRDQLADWLWARESAIQGYEEDQHEAWLAAARLDLDALMPVIAAEVEVRTRTAAAQVADRAEAHYAGVQAVRAMPSDWYCPRSEAGRRRRDCPECVAEVALDAALTQPDGQQP